MAPMKKRVEKEGGKKKQEVMEISSEEEEKKTETSLSSNEIRQETKASVIG
jgi:hypothetical protein